MNKVLVALSALVAWALFLPVHGAAGRQLAAGKGFPITVVDDRGNHVRLVSKPARIVSLDPRDTETLFAVGAESRVVGDGSKYAEGAAGMTHAFNYPSQWPSRWGRDYPVRAKQLAHVEGGCCGTDFNLETIVSLRPDLVFAPYSKTEEPFFQKLHDLGIKVVILDPANVRGILRDIALVGKATGDANQAATVTAEMKAQQSSLRHSLLNVHGKPAVYYEIDATNPTQPYTAGPGTFIDEALTLSGAKNIFHDVTSTGCPGTLCYPQIALEAIIRRDPKYIVLGDAAYGTTPESVKKRAGWSVITAVKNNHVFSFNDELISRAGPRVVIGISKLAHVIHPAAFRG